MFPNILSITNLSESEQLSWDMAKQIIQSQSNLAIIGISVLVGIAVLLMAGSWIWNFGLNKRKLKKAIESLKSEIATKEEENFIKLTKRLEDRVEKIKQEIEKSITERMILFDAEKARLFAFANGQVKGWENAVGWWATAIKGYAKAGEEKLLRVTVDALNMDLGKCEKLEDDKKKQIKNCLFSIPEFLQKEKKQIEGKLNKLPREITKKSETT